MQELMSNEMEEVEDDDDIVIDEDSNQNSNSPKKKRMSSNQIEEVKMITKVEQTYESEVILFVDNREKRNIQ